MCRVAAGRQCPAADELTAVGNECVISRDIGELVVCQDGAVTAACDSGKKECELSASLKIDSSFVADSLAVDVCRIQESDVKELKQLCSYRRMAVSSEMETSANDNECQLQLADTQPNDVSVTSPPPAAAAAAAVEEEDEMSSDQQDNIVVSIACFLV